MATLYETLVKELKNKLITPDMLESELPGIFEDLYKDIDEKKEKIVEKLRLFKYDQFADRIISNYENLSGRFYEEFNVSK